MVDWSIIPFGKHRMKHFSQIDDYRYLCWFIGQLNNECQIRSCANAIIKAIDKKREERYRSNLCNI